MDKWKRIEPTIVTKIDYRNVTIKSFELPDSTTQIRATYGREGSKAAATIAITEEGQVVVARQFRPGPEKVMDEIPGGEVDEGEDPQKAAERELLEETGYTPGMVEFLGEFSRDGYMNGKWFYYLATGCRKTADQSLDENEFVDVHLLSIEEFVNNAKQGRMSDVAAVLAAYDELKKIERNL